MHWLGWLGFGLVWLFFFSSLLFQSIEPLFKSIESTKTINEIRQDTHRHHQTTKKYIQSNEIKLKTLERQRAKGDIETFLLLITIVWKKKQRVNKLWQRVATLEWGVLI